MSETPTFLNIIDWLIKILAVIGGVFGGLPRLLSLLTTPKIIVRNCSIDRAGNTELSWHLFNVPKLYFFGSDARGVITSWNLDSDDKEGWAYSDIAEPIPLIPRGRDWHQRVRESFEVPDGNYTLTLHVTMRGETICVHTEKISPSPKPFMTRLKFDL